MSDLDSLRAWFEEERKLAIERHRVLCKIFKKVANLLGLKFPLDPDVKEIHRLTNYYERILE